MSGRELDPDGTESYHPEHPWEQAGHPLYIEPGQRTSLNWPPAPAYPVSPHEAKQWDNLPARGTPEPSWRREYGRSRPPAGGSGVSRPSDKFVVTPEAIPLVCKLGLHSWPAHVNAYTQAPAPIRCLRGCGATR